MSEIDKAKIKKFCKYVESQLDPATVDETVYRSNFIAAWLEGAYLYDKLQREYPIYAQLLRSTGPDHEFIYWLCHVEFKCLADFCQAVISCAYKIVDNENAYESIALCMDELSWENANYHLAFDYLILTYVSGFVPRYATWKLEQAAKKKADRTDDGGY